jgi:LCP family protein required for cell wall assembly
MKFLKYLILLILPLILVANVSCTPLPYASHIQQQQVQLEENFKVIKTESKVDSGPSVSSRKEDAFNILIMGTDERGTESSRSDVIMLIRYEPEGENFTVLSIPRDCLVNIPGKTANKINAANAFGGVPLMLETVEMLMKIVIDYYIKVDFDGFVNIVDSLGGIDVQAEKDLVDAYTKELKLSKGNHHLNGVEALDYVRFRHDADGDFGRIKRQQEVLIAVLRGYMRLTNISRIPIIIDELKQTVDSNLHWVKLAALALKIKSMDNLNIETLTLKTTSRIINGIWYEIIDDDHLLEMSALFSE